MASLLTHLFTYLGREELFFHLMFPSCPGLSSCKTSPGHHPSTTMLESVFAKMLYFVFTHHGAVFYVSVFSFISPMNIVQNSNLSCFNVFFSEKETSSHPNI
ncbi:hypothetical protein GOODEAATRI_032675 [Goodea atripinnis]|uniref:Cytochrome c biogenesis B n=1 Tax=Goodea atripinnis TaxID=208336 RepID=A0ABV0NZK2_9TELE